MSRSPRNAFTLIEVLLAIAVAAAVFTLAISLFMTTSRTLQGQEKRLSGALRTLEAYMQLEKDLLQTVRASGSSNLTFRLESPVDHGGFSRLSFASLQRLPEEEDLRWNEVIQVTYTVTEEGELIREAKRDAGAPEFPGTRQVLLSDVDEFRLEALYAGQVYAEWPELDEEALPTGVAVHLSVEHHGKEPMKGNILIPSGLVIHPDIERSMQPETLPPGGGL